VACNANGVGSRFRATTNHMEDALPENDSRPLPQNATVIHLPVLIVLGIRAEKFAGLEGPLQHGDVDVLALIPTEISNGTVGNDQLKAISGRVGVPLAILNDCGSDLKKGVELFQQDHPKTISLYDIVHLACRLIYGCLTGSEAGIKLAQTQIAAIPTS
jgi:hypothetical protein